MDEDTVIRGDAQLVYMNPETILSDSGWSDMLVYQKNLVVLSIHEAHLVERWLAAFFRYDDGGVFISYTKGCAYFVYTYSSV